MALIKCPECGKEVSDKAKSCGNCGCPIESLSPNGDVKIKISSLPAVPLFSAKQKASITSADGKVLWEGKVGEVAEIYFEGETEITVKYHTSMTNFGGKCKGVIKPSKSKKYAVITKAGVSRMVLQAVDVIDAD